MDERDSIPIPELKSGRSSLSLSTKTLLCITDESLITLRWLLGAFCKKFENCHDFSHFCLLTDTDFWHSSVLCLNIRQEKGEYTLTL